MGVMSAFCKALGVQMTATGPSDLRTVSLLLGLAEASYRTDVQASFGGRRHAVIVRGGDPLPLVRVATAMAGATG